MSKCRASRRNEKCRSGILTAIVCHFKLRATSSFLPSNQYLISSGRSKDCPRLSATWSSSPLLQVRTYDSEGRGPFHSLKEFCSPEDRRVEDEATSAPMMVGQSTSLGPRVISQVGRGSMMAVSIRGYV